MNSIKLICPTCNFKEKYKQGQPINESFIDKPQFIGIFEPGSIFTNTNDKMCGLYACPKCHSVVYTDSFEFINIKKCIYKLKKKIEKSNKEIKSNEKL